MKLSVIIVTYNCKIVLEECLKSIEKYEGTGTDFELIISDNSTNNEVESLIKEDYEWVRYIRNVNIGFGAGNNRGVEISTGEYLLFLNPDTVLVEPIFNFAIKKFDADERLAMFGVQLIDKNGKKNSSIGLIEKKGIVRDILGWRILVPNGIYIQKEMYIVGADIFIRKDAFLKAGSFDENIFMYHEESDLTRRLLKLDCGYKLDFYPQKQIIHVEGGTSGNVQNKSKESISKQAQSYVYFCEKYNLDPLSFWIHREKKLKIKKVYYALIRKERKMRDVDIDLNNTDHMITEIRKICLE